LRIALFDTFFARAFNARDEPEDVILFYRQDT
jgi:hypothetical protein